MHTVSLPRLGTFDAWRDAARALSGAAVPGDQIIWQMEGAPRGLFEAAATPLPETAKAAPKVPRAFPQLARQICAHRDPGAFDLAYRLLCRVSGAPGLIKNRADADVAQAEALAKNIRRDMHKMKAFVRFRDVSAEGANRRQFISWFEPDHRIEELIAPFFARRFGDMDWVILTPEVTIRFEDGKIGHVASANARPDLKDDTEALWRTYYANIFNPARLKIKAMQSEMPKKYWKNLPEADLIPGLIANAEAQAAQMRANAPTMAPARAARVTERLQEAQRPQVQGGIAGLHQAMRASTDCPWGAAGMMVPGEGRAPAPLMVLGEQPGDHEDLAGRPFVGPAGRLFDQLAQDAGLSRSDAYVTNAVKHFKYQVRGKRRIHQTPTASEVAHYRWWLYQEIALVKPRLIVALGATAARAVTGDGKAITKRRGKIETSTDGTPVLLTLHPAAILRASDATTEHTRRAQLTADLSHAQALLASPDLLTTSAR